MFFSAVFVSYFSMLILLLSILGQGSKSTSLSRRFCVCRPRQFDTIFGEWNPVFFFLVSFLGGLSK